MSLKPGAGQELRKGRDALLAWHLNSPRRSAWRGGPAPITMDTGGTGHTWAPPTPPHLSPLEGKLAELM